MNNENKNVEEPSLNEKSAIESNIIEQSNNKKNKLKYTLMIIIICIISLLLYYLIYVEFIKKDYPKIEESPQKEDIPLSDPAEDKKEEDNNEEEDDYDEEEYISITYISIENERKRFDNLELITKYFNYDGAKYYIGKNNKIYYHDDIENNKSDLLLLDKNNINIKQIYFDGMSENVLVALNKNGELFIDKDLELDRLSSGKNVLFKKIITPLKFSNMYAYFGLPCSECECGFDIIVESDNIRYVFEGIYFTEDDDSFKIFDKDIFNKSIGVTPSCTSESDFTFGINMSMEGKLLYVFKDEKKAELINSETSEKIIGSKLIYIKNSNKEKDMAYIVDINNNLFEIIDYKDSFIKIGVVNRIISSSNDTSYPNKIVIELTDGTNIIIDDHNSDD